jgi:hypothetical protein
MANYKDKHNGARASKYTNIPRKVCVGTQLPPICSGADYTVHAAVAWRANGTNFPALFSELQYKTYDDHEKLAFRGWVS